MQTTQQKEIPWYVNVALGVVALLAVFVLAAQETMSSSLDTYSFCLPWERFTTPRITSIPNGKLDFSTARKIVITRQLIGLSKSDVEKLLGSSSGDEYAIFEKNGAAEWYSLRTKYEDGKIVQASITYNGP